MTPSEIKQLTPDGYGGDFEMTTGGKPMTNYNGRLDKILGQLMSKTADASYGEWQVVGLPEAKQALTSLIKEMVVEANLPNEYQDRLLKMLENENGIGSTS